MEIRYTARREDVGALLRYNLRRSPRMWVILAAFALFPVVVGAVASAANERLPTRRALTFDLTLGLAFAALILFRAWARTKTDERVLSITAEGIHTTIGKLSAELPWARIASVDVTPEYIFITGKNANGFAIPPRAFASPHEREEFVRRLEAFRDSRDHQPAV